MSEAVELLTEELISQVDNSGVMSPGDRAKKVFLYLKESKELTTWDITCFVIEYVSSIALENPILMAAAKVMAKWLYQLHYVLEGYKEERENERNADVRPNGFHGNNPPEV